MKNIIKLFILCLFLFGPGVAQVSASLKFPWANTVSWTWLTRGGEVWHPEEDCETKCAIDLGTSGNYREVLAMDAGTVSSVCTSANTADVYINHGGIIFDYFHIDKSSLEPNIVKDATVVQGQFIGKVRVYNFNELSSCGYTVTATQGTSTGHLHLQVPIPGTYVFEGWSLTYPNTYMTNSGVTKNAGDSFTSTNLMTIRNETINTNKTYTSKNEIIIQDQTIIDGSSSTIIFQPI